MKNINRRSFISKVGVLGIGGIITSLSLKNNLLNATILNSTNTNMFIHPSPFASAENREIYHTVLAQRLKIETARRASERKKIDDAIEKILECPE